MKNLSLSLLLLCSITMTISGQGTRKLFIGILPDITREIKDNDDNVFNINVLPVAAQFYVNEFAAIRLGSILNLQSDTRSISNVGGQLGIPVYPLGKHPGAVNGLYAAPVFGFNHNKFTTANEITLALEPGYSWVLNKGFSMNLGLQLGGTYFTSNDSSRGWRNHTGVKFSLGYTFRSKYTAL